METYLIIIKFQHTNTVTQNVEMRLSVKIINGDKEEQKLWADLFKKEMEAMKGDKEEDPQVKYYKFLSKYGWKYKNHDFWTHEPVLNSAKKPKDANKTA